MKAKRIIAWLLVCVLQLSVCLLIPLRGLSEERKIEEKGESYRFALRAAAVHGSGRHTEVNLVFPQVLPLPEEETAWETTVRVLETGSDGLTRLREHGITWEAAEGYLEPPVWDLYGEAATSYVSNRVRTDLDSLRQIMEDLLSYVSTSPDGRLSDYWRSRLTEQAQALEEPALRDLALRQIDAENGEELFDSYVSGVLYEDTVYWQEVWIAGIHIATLHN